jgi:hypothetical protein
MVTAGRTKRVRNLNGRLLIGDGIHLLASTESLRDIPFDGVGQSRRLLLSHSQLLVCHTWTHEPHSDIATVSTEYVPIGM